MAEALSQYLWPSVAYLLTAVIHASLLLGLVAVGALIFIWMERKIAGRIQDRLGPTRVGGKFGWLQTLADGLKLATKEDTMPRDADPILFKLAPYIGLCASYSTFIVLPFATGWSAVSSSISIFLIIAILGLEVFSVILAGYASGSKWSLFGGMREAAQVVSYEVPLGLCVLVPVMIAGTMDLNAIGEMQRGWFTNWFVFHDPFTFIVFWVFITCATASVNRAPFDLAEAESELVAGFHTEYSGVRWSVFFMAEYNSMLLVSILASILFLGGWHGPIPLFTMSGIAYESAADPFSWGGFLANVCGVTNLLIKGFLGVTAMMWVRWTLPRLRIDQVMRTCLKYCTPIACFCFLGAAVWCWAFPGGLLLKAAPYAGVREADEMVAALHTDEHEHDDDAGAGENGNGDAEVNAPAPNTPEANAPEANGPQAGEAEPVGIDAADGANADQDNQDADSNSGQAGEAGSPAGKPEGGAADAGCVTVNAQGEKPVLAGGEN